MNQLEQIYYHILSMKFIIRTRALVKNVLINMKKSMYHNKTKIYLIHFETFSLFGWDMV